MKSQAIITREFAGHPISQRLDGFMNATAMCKATGKLFADYYRLDTTQAFLVELAKTLKPAPLSDMGIPISDNHAGFHDVVLIEQTYTAIGGYDATFVHPRVAMNLAQWASPEFAVAVSGWVLELIQTGSVPSSRLQVKLDECLAKLDKLLETPKRGRPRKVVEVEAVKPQAPSSLVELVSQYLDGKEEVTVREVMVNVSPRTLYGRSGETRVGIILGQLGWCRKRAGTGGNRRYVYLRNEKSLSDCV